MEFPSIGIDLGTTHCCVAVFRDGEVELIPNDLNEMITPSWIYINGNEIVVGQRARLMAPKNPENVVYDVKRMIGRRFHELNSEDLRRWPFQVVDENYKPVVKVDDKTYTPEELSSMILRKLKEIAEAFLETEVTNVVITVPAQFNNSQRQATIDAASIAGLNVLQLLVEPTAGALAYGLQHASDQERKILVYDLGGGTFDVSVVKIHCKNFQVLATDGNTHLGGQDFEARMVDYFVNEFLEHGSDLSEDRRALLRLKMECEEAKKILSQVLSAKIEIMNLKGDMDLVSNMTRSVFENLIEPYVTNTINTVKEVINSAKLRKDQIDDIVMVGGSSRIPRIQGALRHYFDGKALKKSINPDEAVAYGAAVHAASINGEELLTKVKVCDVTPLSLGVDLVGGFMSVIIPKHTPTPITVTRQYFTSETDQEILVVSVYEGERPMVDDNHKLAEIEIDNLPRGPAGSVKFDYTFHIDANGILTFTAEEKSTRRGGSVNVSYQTGRLTESEINRMRQQAEMHETEDRLKQQRMLSKTELETYCRELKTRASRSEVPDASEVIEVCTDSLVWANTETEIPSEEYETRLNNIMNRFGNMDL